MYKPLFFTFLLLSISSGVVARGTYQEPEDFIRQSFASNPPEVSRLWLKKANRQQAGKIMDRKIPMRIKYWQQGERTAWILNEVGKEQPITAGIVINAGKIEQLKILAFRESRGWEVRYPFFTDQFKQSGLQDDQLDSPIDSITGATLSVRAVSKMARLALYLDSLVQRDKS